MGERNWIKISENSNDFSFKNSIATVYLENKKICVGKHNNKLFAFAFKCPHSGGILADGFIDLLGNVVCPIHRYKFDICNGRNVTGEGYYLKHWPVEVREDGVYVGVESSGSFWDIFR